MTRILVVLPNWFGETLFATPFLRLLRARRPEIFLATLGRPQCRAILLHHPSVNALIDFEQEGARGGPVGAWRLARALRAQRFDTAFILRRSLSRTAVLALAGIRERIGFDNPKSGWLLTRRLPAPRPPTSEELRLLWEARQAAVAPSPPPVHKALSYLPLLGADAAPSPSVSFDYTVAGEERAQARALLEEAGSGRGPLIILHPGANWDHKRWPPDRFARLGDQLAAARRARIVITGAPEDGPLAGSIRHAMRQPATVLAGRTSLRELAACLEQAQLLVSNDTGVLHLAAALMRPLVALYGPTSPVLTGPLGDPSRITVLHHPGCCPRIPCLHPERGPAHPGMESITVEEAYEAACNLLNHHE